VSGAVPFEVVTMGETMLRLSPPAHGRLEHADLLDLNVGGAESNVAVALARLGRRAAWISALPDNPLGRRVAGAVAAAGVDVSGIRYTADGRVGVYFVEFGAAPRATEVFYDRAGSSCAQSLSFDAAMLHGVRFAVLSGITLGLSAHAREVALAFAAAARASGAELVVDVNYRARLWSPEAAREATEILLRDADVVICSARDASTLFGIGGDDDRAGAVELAARFAPAARLVCLTCSERGSVAVERGGVVTAEPAVAATVIDRFGAGDAFVAGVVDSLLAGLAIRDTLAFAARLAALKCTVAGDLSLASRADVNALTQGDMLRR
jgi:2-dehydro-3-deoxygluconokinase